MFSVFCPGHRRTVLLGAADIRALEPAPGGGFVVAYRCSCGHEGQWPSPVGGEGVWHDRMAG